MKCKIARCVPKDLPTPFFPIPYPTWSFLDDVKMNIVKWPMLRITEHRNRTPG